MSAANSKFIADIERWTDRAEQKLDDSAKNIVKEVFIRIVHRTPVASGRLKGSWGLGMNVPEAIASTLDASGSITIAFMTTKLASMQIGGNIIIYNSQPYARRIEYGYSNKAPQGMVRITIAELPQIARMVAGQ